MHDDEAFDKWMRDYEMKKTKELRKASAGGRPQTAAERAGFNMVGVSKDQYLKDMGAVYGGDS